MDVFFNQKPVSPPTNAYAYRGYIETLLNYGPSAKKAGKMDNGEDDNAGLVAHRKLLSTTKSVDLIGHLHCDVFNQEKLLVNGVEVRVRLVRSRDSFCLMDLIDLYSVHIEEANLLVRRVKISPSVLLAHA